MNKTIVAIVILAVLGLLGWKIYEKVQDQIKTDDKGKGKRGKDAEVAVEVTKVRRMTVRDIARFTGSLQARASFEVAPKVAGRLNKLLVNLGDAVKRGQLVATLDDAEYAQAVAEMQAELEVTKAGVAEAQSALEIGKREYERVEAMKQKGVTSEALYDAALGKYRSQSARLRVAEAQLVQREAALKAAEIRLSYTRIHASWEEGDDNRVVGERFVDEGTMLRANDPIVSVLDIDTLTAVIHVIERDYSKIKIGQEAKVTTDAYPDRTFTGRIVRIAPLLMEKARQARVELQIPNQEHVLKPGMFVRVWVELGRKENATVVPATALTRRQKQEGVFVVDFDKMTATFVPLKTGIVSDGLIEVIEPELTGSVVSIGQHLLGENSTIVIPEADKTVKPDQEQPPAPPGDAS